MREQIGPRQGLLKSTFMKAFDGLAVVDADAGCFIAADDMFCRLTGRTPVEFAGLPLADVLPGDSLAGLLKDLDAPRHPAAFAWKIPLLRKDGSRFEVDFSASAIEFPDRRLLALVFRDATLRQSIEDDLLIREEALWSSHTAIALADLDSRLRYVNPAFLRMWGLRESGDAIGRASTEFWQNAADADRVIEAMRTLGKWTGEMMAVRSDGTPFPVELSATMILGSDGRPARMMASFIDITERKRIEEGYRNLNRMHALLSGARKALMRTPDKSAMLREACRVAVEVGGFRMAWIGLLDRESGAVTVAASAGVNEGYTDALTISLGTGPLGCGPTGTCLREGHPSVCNHIAVDERMAPWRGEALSRGYRSSAAFPLVVSGKVRGSLSLYSDQPGFFDEGELRLLGDLAEDIAYALEFSEREARRLRADLELRAAEGRYRTLVEQIPAITYIVDLTQPPEVLFLSPQAETMLGVTPEQWRDGASSWVERIIPEDRERVLAEISGARGAGTGSSFEFRTLDRDGRIIWLRNESAVLRDDRGQPVCIQGVMYDVTERRRIESTKDGLLRDVTHELKTPVAKQTMHLELLKEFLGEECRGRLRDIIGVMEQSLRRQQSVIRNLLDFSRLEAGGRRMEIGPVGLDEVVASVLEEYRPITAGAGMDVAVSIPDLVVRGDGNMLWQAFSNVVGNAVKFRRKEGRGKLEISAAADGIFAVVRFRDDGIGLSAEELARVFERFYQATASTEGTGVGLPFCRLIIGEMGGTVSLESDGPGLGATAVITLPLA